jgi:hypothetical protein
MISHVNMTSGRIGLLLIFTFLAQILMGCATRFNTLDDFSATAGVLTPTPGKVVIESPNPAGISAQATVDTGQSQLLDLARKATQVSLNIAQSDNASAQATKDFNQRQKVELAYQATIVSLNITKAAATQRSISQQTKVAMDSAAAAQSSAVEATQLAYRVMVTQTAQAQAMLIDQTAQAQANLDARNAQALVALDLQASQTAQAVAALTAYPLTATPFAATQAAGLTLQYSREQQAFVDQVVNPIIPYVVVLVLLLFILFIILAFRRFMFLPLPRRLSFLRGNVAPRPLTVIDGLITDPAPRLEAFIPLDRIPANPPGLPGENAIHVEIVNATEPPIAHWIVEAEHKLAAEGGQAL